MIGAQLPPVAGVILADPFPSDGGGFTPVSVSPGLGGFFAMFILAVAVVLLVLDMTRRTRRVKARAQVQERMDAEKAERDAAAAGSATADEGEDAGEESEGAGSDASTAGVGDGEGAAGAAGAQERTPHDASEGSSLENSDDVAGVPADPRISPDHDTDDDGPEDGDRR